MSAPEILATPPPGPGISSNSEASKDEVGAPPILEGLQHSGVPSPPAAHPLAPLAEGFDAGRGQAQSKIKNDHGARNSAHGSPRADEVKDFVKNEESTNLDKSTQYNTAGPFDNSLIRLNTHDTALMALADEHIPSIEKFGEDLQVAITAAWPTRHGNRYEEAHVLLLSWEDDNLGV
ncbi:hypothetical protein NA56DRAFT_25043 [Hyaloscypha hepaticicola]|uniref:Uncharacterized protein n=1 Tax=Hyaloscypha hepaticicola TaxID=2082293 RepID=A0A2J6QCQ5_9HELO|nr:hypothetical protein NA56DRAFT_25043 [Hyaloscypha hepaticicola]